jgi:hypothetical protein
MCRCEQARIRLIWTFARVLCANCALQPYAGRLSQLQECLFSREWWGLHEVHMLCEMQCLHVAR